MDAFVELLPEESNGLLKNIPVVDADTHISEWFDLWTSRAPAKYKSLVPHAVESDGVWEWYMGDGHKLGMIGAVSTVHSNGIKERGLSHRRIQLHQAHPGCYDAKARIKLMDELGIAAQIAYPNLMGFGGQNAMRLDEELRNVSTMIYNDAMAEFQADSNNRVYPMITVPWWDVKLAVAEVERSAAMGLRGINMNSDPHNHGLPSLSSEYWNPLWELCSDKGLPVNFHIGASDESTTWWGTGMWPGEPFETQLAYGSVMMFVGNARVMANIIVSRFLEKFPKLKVVSVESGAGWVPFLLEALEYQMIESLVPFDIPPKELFARQIYVCSWFEKDNFADTVRQIGQKNVLFETDFPHPTCLYPNAQTHMKSAIEKMSEGERQDVFSSNAQRVYNLDLSMARG